MRIFFFFLNGLARFLQETPILDFICLELVWFIEVQILNLTINKNIVPICDNDHLSLADCPALSFRYVYLVNIIYTTNKYLNVKQLSLAIN